jgi:hypothetical protein
VGAPHSASRLDRHGPEPEPDLQISLCLASRSVIIVLGERGEDGEHRSRETYAEDATDQKLAGTLDLDETGAYADDGDVEGQIVL